MNESQSSNQPSPQPVADSIGEPTAAPNLKADVESDEPSTTADVQVVAAEDSLQTPTSEDSSPQPAADSIDESTAAPELKADVESDEPSTATDIQVVAAEDSPQTPTSEELSPQPVADSIGESTAAPELKADVEGDEPSTAANVQVVTPEDSPKSPPVKKLVSTEKSTASSTKSEKSFLQQVLEKKIPINGKVIGWNKGGFHIVVDGVAAFCPRSEMELGNPREPKSYIDEEFEFLVLKIQEKGRRIIVSRNACLMAKRSEGERAAVQGLEVGAVLEGTVATITEFGAFVDLNGVQGLVHISELSQRRIEKAEEVVQIGQTVKVKILKLSNDGKRISLSIKALEPNPWQSILERYPGGSLTKGRVERTNRYGAFIELEPGITGLLPASGMSLPRDTSPERAYPPGKQLSVQILSIDAKKHRISLGLEGSSEEGSRKDYQKFVQKSAVDTSSGFNALASAFAKIQDRAN